MLHLFVFVAFLYWAYSCNVLAMPIAILGLLHPVIAEMAMAGSSISVVTNANRLKKVKPRLKYIAKQEL